MKYEFLGMLKDGELKTKINDLLYIGKEITYYIEQWADHGDPQHIKREKVVEYINKVKGMLEE